MGRSVPNLFRAAVIACACAMLFFCVSAARAQSTNDDGYGFIPVPGLSYPSAPPAQPAQPQPNYAQAPPVAAPMVQLQQAPMMPNQAYAQPAYSQPAYPQPGYAPPP